MITDKQEQSTETRNSISVCSRNNEVEDLQWQGVNGTPMSEQASSKRHHSSEHKMG